MKKCTKCGEQKPLSEFTKKKQTKDGLDLWCKHCKSAADKYWRESDPVNAQNNKQRATAWNIENTQKRKIIVKRNNYKKRYGLSIEQKQSMVDDHNGACAICKAQLKDAHDACVDHCHTTNMVRGILCRKCNLGIGHFNDSIQALTAAIEYLSKYAPN
jgi:hypothetical protein